MDRLYTRLAVSDDRVEANLATIRRGYETWNVDGVEALVQHFATADLVFHEAPETPDTGVFHGAEAFAIYMRELEAAWGHFQLDVRSLEGRADYVLAALEMSLVSASGVPLTAPIFHVIRVRDGRALEIYAYLNAEDARREYGRLTGSTSG